MRIVVSGAGGFLGGHVVGEVARHDVDLVALVGPGAEAAWLTDFGVRVEATDLRDGAALRTVLRGARYVVNGPRLATPGHAAPAYAAANVESTTALLDASLEAEVEGFVQLSSTLTYGASLPDWAVDESWAARPCTAVDQSLATAERVARTYRRRLPLLVLRAAPTFGPRDDGVLQRTLDYFMRARRPRLVCGGRARISLAYGPDLGRAAWAALEALEETQDRILHVKSIDTDWRSVVAQARAMSGRGGRPAPIPLWVARLLDGSGGVGRRLLDAPAGVERYTDLTARPHVIDDTPLRALTGFAPLFGLRGALRHTLDLEPRD